MRTLPLLLLLVASPLVAQTPEPSIVPRPVSVSAGDGAFTLEPATVIWADSASAELAAELADYLEPATGYRFRVEVGGIPLAGIRLRRDPGLERLGEEGYSLQATRDGIEIRSAGAAGTFYGIQTLRQLLPPEILRDARVEGVEWTVPAVRIEDRPRFGWRGAHLDVVRHFMPLDFVKKYIDLLALHKMNSFHWHLTDDQGWRIEIRKYPRLTEVGAWRKETMIPPFQSDPALRKYDGVRHGGFYTQEDVREIVEYARKQFVNVVPEIEMPGHASAAIAAYPRLGVGSEPSEVATYWGVFSNIFNASDSTIAFLQDVLTEVMELFPSRFIHVGGDEADKAWWKESPRIQARIRELGLKDEHELQSWLIRQMDKFLAERGRRLIGWDEILEGGLAPGATVMSWRGFTGGLAAARAGHDVVMSPTQWSYFDYYQSADRANEPHSIGGFLPIDTVYAFNPVPAALEPQYRHHILGAQFNLWTEYIATTRHAEYMAYPRGAAMAEVVWTPVERKDFADFKRRLAVHLQRLDALSVNYREPRE